ncbi:MAG: phosphotransferase enzyme family protein [Nocardioidaceae bacterium]
MIATRVPHVPRPSRVSAALVARFGPLVLDPSVTRAVLGRYGLDPRAGYRNLRLARRSLNTVVETDHGTKVVKAYRPHWSPGSVECAHSILVRLEELGFPAVRLVRAPEGATWTAVGAQLFAVFDFVPGKNYSIAFLRRADRLCLTEVAGRTLASLHRRLDGFVPGGAHHLGFAAPTGPRRRDVAWHAAKLDELVRHSAELTSPGVASHVTPLVTRASSVLDEIDRLERLLDGAAFPRLVVHGDYGLHNLVFPRPDRAVPVDFELSRFEWRLFDLISVLGKHRYRGGRYDLESMVTLLGAYSKEFALTPDERRLLPDAWRLYKLHAAVQYWNSYFETNGPARKLASSLDSIAQADLVTEHPEIIHRLVEGSGR